MMMVALIVVLYLYYLMVTFQWIPYLCHLCYHPWEKIYQTLSVVQTFQHFYNMYSIGLIIYLLEEHIDYSDPEENQISDRTKIFVTSSVLHHIVNKQLTLTRVPRDLNINLAKFVSYA